MAKKDRRSIEHNKKTIINYIDYFVFALKISWNAMKVKNYKVKGSNWFQFSNDMTMIYSTPLYVCVCIWPHKSNEKTYYSNRSVSLIQFTAISMWQTYIIHILYTVFINSKCWRRRKHVVRARVCVHFIRLHVRTICVRKTELISHFSWINDMMTVKWSVFFFRKNRQQKLHRCIDAITNEKVHNILENISINFLHTDAYTHKHTRFP